MSTINLVKKKDRIVNQPKSEFENFKVLDLIPFDMAKIERTQTWDPHFELIEKAYDKIYWMWNESPKSRNFIKHLVAAHLPIDQFRRAFNVSEEDTNSGKFVCCILGDKLTGLKNCAESLSKIGMDKMMLSAHLTCENREATKEEIDEINAKIEAVPQEVRDARIAYLSEKSDKILSQEAILALRHFAINIILISDELNYTMNRMKLNHLNETTDVNLSKKEVRKVAQATTYGVKDHVDQSTIDKLAALKAKMEQSEK